MPALLCSHEAAFLFQVSFWLPEVSGSVCWHQTLPNNLGFAVSCWAALCSFQARSAPAALPLQSRGLFAGMFCLVAWVAVVLETTLSGKFLGKMRAWDWHF